MPKAETISKTDTMKKALLIFAVVMFLLTAAQAQTVSDIEGNTYNTVTIGTQTWMKENLKTTRFNNGDLIETSTSAVNNDSTSVYQWAYKEDVANVPVYGRLYTWFVVNDSRNVCPAGWHVPGEIEWTDMANFLGGDTLAGDKMKEAGTTHWSASSLAVTNSSNFTGLPGGLRGNPSGFSNVGVSGNFWTSTAWGLSSFPRAVVYHLKSGSGALEQSAAVANCGLSVRCVKNTGTNIESLSPENKVGIYPNPSKGILNISLEAGGNYKISIYTVSGTLVHQTYLTDKISKLDIRSLTKGIYVVRIENAGSRFEREIIVE